MFYAYLALLFNKNINCPDFEIIINIISKYKNILHFNCKLEYEILVIIVLL